MVHGGRGEILGLTQTGEELLHPVWRDCSCPFVAKRGINPRQQVLPPAARLHTVVVPPVLSQRGEPDAVKPTHPEMGAERNVRLPFGQDLGRCP